MDKGQSQRKRNRNRNRKRNRKRKRAEEESIEGASTSSIPTRKGDDQYDIFLSFRGSDTRKGFTDHLYCSLINAGTVPISVFRDDNSLEIGEDFNSEILNAITRSKISIPIISENYASSKWCLCELVRIMDCKKSMSHIVLPIFYKVDPSDVRFLKGNFGKAFDSRKHRFSEKDIQEGKQALEKVSYLNGWESEKFANGHEGELVEKVVENVLSNLQKDFQLDVTKQLVGIEDHVKEIRNWVDNPASVARMIGIYGMGGIGKTTLAKEIYNQLSNDFVHHSFLADIRANSILNLQKQLIEQVLRIKQQVWNVDDGINLINSKFKGKKVLILLDDIDHNAQLDALARERSWFASGSIIIVTTRDKAVLDQSNFGVDYPCKLEGLNKVDSLLLFRRHAFRTGYSWTDFEDTSRKIISTMGGLPLALKVVGASLNAETNQEVWREVLEKLEKEPDGEVQKILKISYDALDDNGHQKIFLDIACFFIGEKSKFPIYMWKDCGYSPHLGIKKLEQRCLIKIGNGGEFMMHDQLRDLGRSIFCRGQAPEKCLKLWANQEAFTMRQLYQGYHRRDRDWPNDYHHRFEYTSEHFKILPRSRFLQLCYTALSGDFNGPFSELRWLRWSYAELDLSFSKINFHLSELVVLELPRNKLTDNWGGWRSIMAAKRLKVLNLSYSHHLTCTPDLSAFTELEILNLNFCHRLKQVHRSIGKVKSLVSLNLTDCFDLEELPTEVGELKELKELRAYGCGKLRKIPSSIGDLQNLQLLDLRNSAIKELPSSIGRLKKLRELYLEPSDRLKGYLPREIGDLSSLETLCVTGTLIADLPQDCKELRSLPALPSGLTYLEVSSSPVPSLPQLSCLIHLEELHLYECNQLEDIPELPSRLSKLLVNFCPKLMLLKLDGLKDLEELSIVHCNSIERMDLSQLNSLKTLDIHRCDDLIEIQIQGELEFLKNICIRFCKSIETLILPKLQCLEQLEASSCENIVEIQGLDKAELLVALCISDCRSIERLPDLRCFTTLKELNINGCCNLRGVENLERFLSC